MAILKSSNTSSTTSAAGMKRPRTVRFCNTVKHVQTRRMEPVQAIWLSKAELTNFKLEIKKDLNLYFSGAVSAVETNTTSWRGLESYTQRHTKFQKHRKERRSFLVNGVKDLKQRLEAEGLPTGNSIRKLVTIASKQAVEEAQKLAAVDAAAANQIYLETFLAPMVLDNDKSKMDTITADMPIGIAQGIATTAPHQQLVMARTA